MRFLPLWSGFQIKLFWANIKPVIKVLKRMNYSVEWGRLLQQQQPGEMVSLCGQLTVLTEKRESS